MHEAHRRGKAVFLPVIPGGRGRRLAFGHMTASTRLRANRFGILEPDTRRLVTAPQLDLILLPLVAFDVCGNRVGMGGGYYDASLGYLRQRRRWRRPRLLGVAHELQRVDHIDVDRWDVALDGVVTDQAFYPSPTAKT